MIGKDARLADAIVVRTMIVPMDPERGLILIDERRQIRAIGWCQLIAAKFRLDRSRVGSVMTDDDRRSLKGLAEALR